MVSPNNNDDDKDLTRIEDLPPLEHPPLPSLPESFAPIDLPIPPNESEQPPLHQEPPMMMDNLKIDTEIKPLPIPKNENSSSLVDLTLPKLSASEPEIKINDSAKFFSDVKEELETFVVKHVPFESYPSYSLLISNIKSNLQKKEIQLLLKEYSLLQSDTEKDLVDRSLMLGHLLIPRISEYAAIFFANKFELLNLTIQFSPSSDLSMESDLKNELWDRGPLTDASFHHHHEEGKVLKSKNDIFISTKSKIPNKKIKLLGQIVNQTLAMTVESFENMNSNVNLLHDKLEEIKKQARDLTANAVLSLEIKVLHEHNNEVQLLITGEAAIIHGAD